MLLVRAGEQLISEIAEVIFQDISYRNIMITNFENDKQGT